MGATSAMSPPRGTSAGPGQRERLERHRHFDLRPATDAAAHAQCATDRLRTLAHAEQAEVSGTRRLLGVEPATVVRDAQAERVVVVAKVDLDVRGLPVAHGVGERLLADA